jgi:hypothetical protein
MSFDQARVNALSGGVFLIGLGVLFYTDYWWPGIVFLLGAEAAVQALARGRGWYGLQGAVWLFAIGFWAMFDFNIALLFVALGVSVLISAFIRPPMLTPKPHVDDTLE